MTSEPLVMVTASQITAANLLHDEHMPGWAATDRALMLLAEAIPGFGQAEVTLKAAAVDRLYYTSHYRLLDAIGHIVEVMCQPPPEPIRLVETIAQTQVANGVRWHWSFASKLCHWFVNDNLPMYDAWAVRTISYHFGTMRRSSTIYRDFAEHVYSLRVSSGLACSVRELDRYLWLAGMYRAWIGASERVKLQLSEEVRGVFGSRETAVHAALKPLLA